MFFRADFGVAGSGVGSFSASQRAASSSASIPTLRSRSPSFWAPRLVIGGFRLICGQRSPGYDRRVHHVLAHRPPWWVVGPSLGLIVVAVQATLNDKLGVVGGVSAVVERTSGRAPRLGWKAFFLLGIVLGGTAYGLLSGRAGITSYGWLTRTFTADDRWLVAPVLVGAGLLIGWGAKTAGGCTSGNGLVGCARGSASSMVATATFFGTAIVASFVLRWLGAA